MKECVKFFLQEGVTAERIPEEISEGLRGAQSRGNLGSPY
jgi:hypothetical protein